MRLRARDSAIFNKKYSLFAFLYTLSLRIKVVYNLDKAYLVIDLAIFIKSNIAISIEF